MSVLLVERAMEKIKVNIRGQSTQANTNKLATGAKLNERIKKGALIASEKARNTLKVEHLSIYGERAKSLVVSQNKSPFSYAVSFQKLN